MEIIGFIVFDLLSIVCLLVFGGFWSSPAALPPVEIIGFLVHPFVFYFVSAYLPRAQYNTTHRASQPNRPFGFSQRGHSDGASAAQFAADRLHARVRAHSARWPAAPLTPDAECVWRRVRRSGTDGAPANG